MRSQVADQNQRPLRLPSRSLCGEMPVNLHGYLIAASTSCTFIDRPLWPTRHLLFPEVPRFDPDRVVDPPPAAVARADLRPPDLALNRPPEPIGRERPVAKLVPAPERPHVLPGLAGDRVGAPEIPVALADHVPGPGPAPHRGIQPPHAAHPTTPSGKRAPSATRSRASTGSPGPPQAGHSANSRSEVKSSPQATHSYRCQSLMATPPFRPSWSSSMQYIPLRNRHVKGFFRSAACGTLPVMAEVAQRKDPHAVALGRRGGRARWRDVSKEERARKMREVVRIRWALVREGRRRRAKP